MMDDLDFSQRLNRFLACVWPDALSIEVAALGPIVGGWSKRMFSLDVTLARQGGTERQKLILRTNAPDNSAILRNDRVVEHRLLAALAQHTRLPVPRSVFVDAKGQFFGAQAMLLEHLPAIREYPRSRPQT